jgi:hypothetical protein
MLLLDTIWTRRKKISEERLSVCKSCVHIDLARMKCRKCGCFMEYKSLLMDAECPIDKWNEIPLTDSLEKPT